MATSDGARALDWKRDACDRPSPLTALPELPEAETIVRGLRRTVVGQRVRATRVLHEDVLREPKRSFARKMRDAAIVGVERRAKNVVIRLDGGRVLAVNLGMTGGLLPFDAPPRGASRPTHPAVRFRFESGGVLVFDDTRRFGTVECLTEDEWAERSARLGPEPLDPSYRAADLHDGLRRSRAPVRSWLLDQRRIAGVGNIYANEALHLAGIHPRCPAGSITAGEASRLHRAVRRVLRGAIEAGGTTIRDYRTAEGGRGDFGRKLRVYGREGEPCPRCGAAVRRVVFANRSAFHCPTCQPEAKEAGRARRTRGVVPRGSALALCSVLAFAALLPHAASAQTATTERAGSAVSTPGERLPVHEVRLDNGMRFLLLRRPGAPTISFVVQLGIGAVHEHPGTTGTAHLLEHMLFKGTTTIGTTDVEAERALFRSMDAAHDTLLRARSREDSAAVAALEARIEQLEDSARAYVVPNEFDRILTRAGAQGLNAMTTSESTIYFVELPSNRAELWFALEADRMRNPVFREFYTERDVVMEERRMRVETSPGGLLYELHLATAYTVHPYGQPVVGHMSDLRSLRRSDVASYYERYYGPGNAVVAVVGDIDPERMEAWARRYFGPLPPGEEPPPVLAEEPPQRGERRVVLEWDAEPLLRIGWHVPSSLHEDGPALAVLSSLLTGGRTARLYDRLVTDDRLAATVFSSTGPGRTHPQLFQIDLTPRAPATPGQAEAAIYEELALLAAEGPTPDELERVGNRIEAGSVRRLQSNLGLAFQLASSESLAGDWRETFRASARLRMVRAEDVRRVLRTYFTESNRTVATLVRRDDG